MPALTHKTFDFDQLSIGNALRPNKAGGKYAQVGYGPDKAQVHFQLGVSPKDALRCPFGMDRPKEDPDKPYVKLELTEDTHAFVEKLEAAVLEAAEANSVAWFKKQHPASALQSMLTSMLKPQYEDRPDCVKIKVNTGGKDPTVVLVAHWKGDKLRKPVNGSLDDLLPDAMILPIVKVQGGVWFMNGGKSFGASLAATVLLVVKPEGASTACGKRKFDMGDVEFTDGEEDEDED